MSRSLWGTACWPFGWPQVHEDEAERAVRAGIAVVDAINCLSLAIRRLHNQLEHPPRRASLSLEPPSPHHIDHRLEPGEERRRVRKVQCRATTNGHQMHFDHV